MKSAGVLDEVDDEPEERAGATNSEPDQPPRRSEAAAGQGNASRVAWRLPSSRWSRRGDGRL